MNQSLNIAESEVNYPLIDALDMQLIDLKEIKEKLASGESAVNHPFIYLTDALDVQLNILKEIKEKLESELEECNKEIDTLEISE